MGRKTDLSILKFKTQDRIVNIEERFQDLSEILFTEKQYLIRWVAAMSLIELYSIWEKYTEDRLIIAINNYPEHFNVKNNLKGAKSIPKKLAKAIVKGNANYFNIKSTEDLISKANLLVGNQNPFLSIEKSKAVQYLDALQALRNEIVHSSEVSISNRKKKLKTSFNQKMSRAAIEFIDAIDNRKSSPLQGAKRLLVLTKVVRECIEMT